MLGLLQDAVDTGVNHVVDGTTSLDVQVCFVAGTQIRLSSGEIIPVEEARPGMKVRVPNENDPEGEHYLCEIVEVYHNPPAPVIRLEIESESTGRKMTVRGTENHRFYVVGFGWKAIRDLEIGDRFLSENGEKVLVLAEKELEPEPVPVYNFQVRGCHTYFVGETTEDSVLVHNEECGGSSSADPLDELDNLIHRTKNPIVKVNAIGEIKLTTVKIKGGIDTTVSTLGGAGGGLAAGSTELAYKGTRPIVWTCWGYDVFYGLADVRDQAWVNSGLNGTATQTISQSAANVSVAAGYALLLKGPIIREVGKKTLNDKQLKVMNDAAQVAHKTDFLSLSATDKAAILFQEQGIIGAIAPSSRGLTLGTTTNYGSIWGHAPSYDTVILGVPGASMMTYGWHKWVWKPIMGGNNNNQDNNNE